MPDHAGFLGVLTSATGFPRSVGIVDEDNKFRQYGCGLIRETGERAKVVRIDKDKEEVTVELVEVAVPIPVTIKLGTVKVLPK